MYKLAIVLGATATLITASAIPSAAQAHRHHHHSCQRAEHRAGTGGAILGGGAGALVGNAVTHGSVAGTVIGGVGGALIGHKVGQDSHNC